MCNASFSDWHCQPQGLFSWDYKITGEGNEAELRLRAISDGGDILVDGERFRFKKQSWLKGHWALIQNDKVIAEAKKQGLLSQTVAITVGEQNLVLSSDSIFGRSFTLTKDSIRIASFRQTGWFRRNAVIRTHQEGTNFLLCCFSFGIVVVLWRRAANSG